MGPRLNIPTFNQLITSLNVYKKPQYFGSSPKVILVGETHGEICKQYIPQQEAIISFIKPSAVGFEAITPCIIRPDGRVNIYSKRNYAAADIGYVQGIRKLAESFHRSDKENFEQYLANHPELNDTEVTMVRWAKTYNTTIYGIDATSNEMPTDNIYDATSIKFREEIMRSIIKEYLIPGGLSVTIAGNDHLRPSSKEIQWLRARKIPHCVVRLTV
jgi:hypothetical protein